MAAVASFQSGAVELAWEHAIKAQQGGFDMTQVFAAMRQQSPGPDDLDAQLSVARVFVMEGIDSTALERGGTNLQAKTTLSFAAGDIFDMQQEARRRLSDSRSFGLVARQDMADLLLVFEVDDLTISNAATRFRGVLKLVDARSGEEAYRRRIDFDDIASRSYLNREFNRVMGLLEEWAAAPGR